MLGKQPQERYRLFSFPQTSYPIHLKSGPKSPVSAHTLLSYHPAQSHRILRALKQQPSNWSRWFSLVCRKHSSQHNQVLSFLCPKACSGCPVHRRRSQAHTRAWKAPPNLEPSPPSFSLPLTLLATWSSTTLGLRTGCRLGQECSSHGQLYGKSFISFRSAPGSPLQQGLPSLTLQPTPHIQYFQYLFLSYFYFSGPITS